MTRWVVDVARLRVAVALAQPAAPRRALAGHVVVLSLVIALWLAYAAHARLVLTVMGPEALGFLTLWRLLPGEALGAGLGLVPLAVCALLAVLPIRARLLAGSWRPAGSWFWRDPTGGGDAGIGVPEVVSTAPRWSLPVVIGLAAGVAAGLAPLGVLLVGLVLDPVVRESETFSVAIGEVSGHCAPGGRRLRGGCLRSCCSPSVVAAGAAGGPPCLLRRGRPDVVDARGTPLRTPRLG